MRILLKRGMLSVRTWPMAAASMVLLLAMAMPLHAQTTASASAPATDTPQQALQKAQQAFGRVDSRYRSIAGLARANAGLAQRRIDADGTIAQIKQLDDDLAHTSAELARLEIAFDNVMARTAAAGNSRSVYTMLRREQAALPDASQLQSQLRTYQARLEQARQEQFDLDDLRTSSADVDVRVKEVMQRLPADVSQNADLQRQAASLLADRLPLIDALKADYAEMQSRLEALEARHRRLLDETLRFTRFIDERVLWIRSTESMSYDDFPRAGDAIVSLSMSSRWPLVGQAYAEDATDNWPLWCGIVLPLAVLVVLRGALVRRLGHLPASGSQRLPASIRHSLEALALTLLIAAPIPVLVLAAGWRLTITPDASAFVQAIATGLLATGMTLATLELFRQVCRAGGLAQAHFLWPQESLRSLRPWLGRLIVVTTPLIFLAGVTSYLGDDLRNISLTFSLRIVALGRLAFVLAMLSLSAFCVIVLRPSGRIFNNEKVLRTGWLYRLRHVWFLLAVGLPLLLAAASAAGYHYTALQLSHRLLVTIILVLAVVLLHSLLSQWMGYAISRLVSERLRKQAARSNGTAAESTPLAVTPVVACKTKLDPNEMKLSTIESQSRQILRYLMAAILLIGGYFIWVSVLPALAVFRNIELWSQTASVIQSVVGPDGVASTSAVEKLVPVTLGDVLWAVVLAILTVAGSRNIPGLLEITLLRRMNWDFGVRYAFTTIVRYIIFVVGIVMVFGQIGLTWSKVQWLIAAITVGLGFGLQEIFANFVSGLILLFERPMRVGDMVTVGDVTGIVTKIRIRATTIMDLDRKELVVPNKEFITGKLMNWTLTDSTLRTVIPVGVNYAADTHQVLDLLMQAAREHADVMPTPPPECEFVGFGDSSLNFELRVFVKDWPTSKKVKNELQIAILQAFRQAGISIPFPQREIHVRNVPPETKE